MSTSNNVTYYTDKKSDAINPNHYKGNGMEVIDVMEAFMENVSGVEAVCMGNVIKYILRWHNKNGVEDLMKARWYLDRLISYQNQNPNELDSLFAKAEKSESNE